MVRLIKLLCGVFFIIAFSTQAMEPQNNYTVSDKICRVIDSTVAEFSRALVTVTHTTYKDLFKSWEDGCKTNSNSDDCRFALAKTTLLNSCSPNHKTAIRNTDSQTIRKDLCKTLALLIDSLENYFADKLFLNVTQENRMKVAATWKEMFDRDQTKPPSTYYRAIVILTDNCTNEDVTGD